MTGDGSGFGDSRHSAVLPGYHRNRFDGNRSGEALPRSRHRWLHV